MKKYIESKGLVFEFDCREDYDKTKANKIAKSTPEEEIETTFIEGNLKVTAINILQKKYSNESVAMTRSTVVRLNKYINEIESQKCKMTVEEWFQ